MNYGRIDISSITLAAKQWTFALPRNLHWPTVRANPPVLKEPEGRHFIQCIQHWIIRFPRQYANRFRRFAFHELDQETILVDNHGQVYVIYALAGLDKDWGVRYFTMTPDASYTPLTSAQIEAVKSVELPAAPEGEEGLPSWKREHEKVTQAIRDAIKGAEEVFTEATPDALVERGIFEQVAAVPMNPPALEEPEPACKKPLYSHTIRALQEAYIHIQHSKIPTEKEDGHRLLSSYLKAVMPKQFHRRIDTMNRTILTRKLSKYYEITWPKSTDKVLPPLPEERFAAAPWLTHAQYGYLY
jgi:hypothetical protein